MKILMISKNGDGFGLAQKLKEEGHDLKIWVKEDGFDFVLVGIIEQVSSWRPAASDWADFVIADMVGFGRFATALDNFKVPHLGFNPIADMMELDRGKQMQLFGKFSIPTPSTDIFQNPGAAKDNLDDFRSVVIKPSGNLDTGKTLLVEDIQTFEWALEQYSGDQDLIVQDVVKGIEISTEGWFDGSDWILPFNHTIEYKRLMSGDIGPNTGCMGNVVWAVQKPEKDEFVKNLKKLTPFLKAASYKGPIDINTIANASGIFALEITARFGYDAIEALYELFKERELGEILMEIARGGETVNLPVRQGDYSVAVRLSVPPYPHRAADKRDKGMPISGVPNDLEHVFLTDVFFNNGSFMWSASDGVLMKVTGSGKDVKSARQNVQKIVSKIHAPGLMFRDDIGVGVDGSISKLKAWGYLPSEGILRKVIG